MNTKKVIALALATALGVSMSAAYADYDRGHDRDYRSEHRDSRNYRRDEHRDHYRHDYVRRDYGPHGYVVERPVYMSPPVVYAPPMPSSLEIVVPLHF